MNLSKRRPFLSSLGLILLVALLLFTSALPVQAALGITGVQPGTVSNVSAVTLTITGTDFVSGAQVILSGHGSLSTTFVSDTTLTAALPAGVPAGVYAIQVSNPDATSVTLPSALTITSPNPTQGVDEPTTQPYQRPVVVVENYRANVDSVTPAQEFNLVIKFVNEGQRPAANIVAVFTVGDFSPRETGGVVALPHLDAGDSKKIEQPLIASWDILGKTVATASMQISYTDPDGVVYSETFNISLPVTQGRGGPTRTPTPTATSQAVARPQMVISGYGTDVDTLQPGTRFTLALEVNNVGNTVARRVTMILGGGSGGSGGLPGTAEPGGVSGGAGDFGTFAPVAASNVQFLGDLEPGSRLSPSATLIVNATANPGAYPMKITFTYTSENGTLYNDDQVVTLLVFSLPQVEVNFYRDPGQLFVGQPNQLPIQVVNLGRKPAVLGNMTITSEGAELSNNTTLVGSLDPGGYFTLDAMAVPFSPGPLELQVKIDYTDDFNQAQSVQKTIQVEVQDAPVVEPPVDGGVGPDGQPLPGGPDGGVGPGVDPGAAGSETVWQKVVRFFRGLFGLDSGQATPVPGEIPPGELPPEEAPVEGVPVPGPKG